ncbi:MAG: alkaline phosphatase family protein [Candidatus Krumholzibacteria bacterium]|nr:alkaline phosphatase family protein [Candidatus Krumholzibacteria bacterium]
MAFKLFKRDKKKACVVGLDGVPHSLLTSLIQQGVMPNTQRIVQCGVLRSMTVTLPEISSVSWSTFMTAKNPGEHGIFGFTDLKEHSYELRFPSFRDLKTDTIWDRLGRAGLQSIVINQPSTYPAREIPGVLIAGFVAIDLMRAVYPRKYMALLTRCGYQVDIDTAACRDNPRQLFSELASLLECRQTVTDELWKKEDWHLMEVVITGTDRLHHFAWDAYEDAAHPHHGDFLDYYRQVDAFIGHIHDRFVADGGNDNFFLLSDHGFCGTQLEVYINTLLEENGFLSFEGDEGLESISADSRAFALDPARIYIHRKDRYPRGGVDESDVPSIKRALTSMFEAVTHDSTGDKIVRRVFDGGEVYSGPHAHQGPDLLLIPKNGYDLKGRVGAKTVVGERRLQGMHTWDDAFFYSGRQDLLSATEELTIFDVPGKVLRSLDVDA